MPTVLTRMLLEAYHLTFAFHGPINTIIPTQPISQCNYLIHDVVGGELTELTDL